MIKTALAGYGYDITEAASGHEGLSRAAITHPELIILDLGLPDLDGIDVIKQLREWTEIPIIVLSVREHEEDKIKALDAGADDYITKPFSMGELHARIRATLRHKTKGADEPVLTFGELTIDVAHRNVAGQREANKADPDRIRDSKVPGSTGGSGGDPWATPPCHAGARLSE